MKKVLEYLPILTICLLYFGFCNLFFFYKEFKIDIYNYINNAEILLSLFPTIVVIASSIYSGIIGYVVGRSNPKQNNISDEAKQSNRAKLKNIIVKLSFPGALILYSVMHIGLIMLFLKVFHFKEYKLQDFYVLSSIFLLLIIWLYVRIGNESIFTKQSFIFSVGLLIYIGTVLQTQRRLDALKIKDGIAQIKISFKYDNEIISTSPLLVYIGQTQNYLFLYNKVDSSSKIFKMSNMDSISIKSLESSF